MLGHIKVSVISNLFPLTFSPIINSLLTYSGVEYQLRLRVNLHLPRTFLVDIQKNWYSNDFINSYEVEIHSVGDFLFFFFFFFTFGVLICTWCMHWAPSLVWSQSKSSQICWGPISNSIPSGASSSSSPLLMSSNSWPSPSINIYINYKKHIIQ